MLEIERKATRDGVISIDTKQYEVPYNYASKKVIIYYTPDMSEVFLRENDGSLKLLNILNKKINSRIKRVKFTEEDSDVE